MQNLLRTLTERRVKPTDNLKELLAAVKRTRRDTQDSKLSDAFYDSLDNLLADLRTISIDNRDAEAFLKPVSRAEVPDYYDYITNPMDFATMARKLKHKQYKSKREFKADLDLIWSNCYKYNAAEDHPLRQCADRLRAKAERLLKYITDRKDRIEPQAFESTPTTPTTVGIARPKVNGVNGATHHKRTPSTAIPTPTPSSQPIASSSSRKLDVPFAESPALIRTPEGMVLFRELDRGLSSSSSRRAALGKLKALVPDSEHTFPNIEPEELAVALGAVTGDKRKSPTQDGRPRKRARFADTEEDLAISQLWWDAAQSEGLIANGLPEIPYASSSSSVKPKKRVRTPKRSPTVEEQPKKSMLTLMNNNIKAMRRVRTTHAKLTALVASTGGGEEGGEGAAGEGGAFPMGQSSSTMGGVATSAPVIAGEEDVNDDRIDERHWLDIVYDATNTGSLKKKGKTRTRRPIEIGEESAQSCTRWVGEKILEHAGFQGASRGAMDVLNGVFMDYLGNVGRSIRYMTDKYAGTMTPEEIILHTLFESGVSKVQELDKFITDDIERYGTRLLELEKKLVGAYRDSTAGEALEDEGLFEEEDEEEAGALAMGDFADSLGEDYLGLRESGIAAEFGLSTLSIPKKLLRRKKVAGANAGAAASKAVVEKPLDYPLPPPQPKFTYSTVGEQIGLLREFYERRFEEKAVKAVAERQAQPPLPMGAYGSTPYSSSPFPLPRLPGPSMPSLPGPQIGLGPPPLPAPSLAPAPATGPYPTNPYPTSNGIASSSTNSMGLPQMPATSAKHLPPPIPGPPSVPSLSQHVPSVLGVPPLSQSHYPGQQLPAAAPPLVEIPPDLELPDDAIPSVQTKMGPLGQIAKAGGSVSSSKKKSESSKDKEKGGGAKGANLPPLIVDDGMGGPLSGLSSATGAFTFSHSTSGSGGGGGTTFIPTIIGPNGAVTTTGKGSYSSHTGGGGGGSHGGSHGGVWGVMGLGVRGDTSGVWRGGRVWWPGVDGWVDGWGWMARGEWWLPLPPLVQDS
ncbi:SAGA complex protein [Ephemerocybe angulata]|uniref:SAGA complex protein n=1 Tax=Ephemerocybe angulata TaxID=980116 RepID=A0A8H6M0F1_9AGAR|nr:SAGA complex protein [Tulosesus angulatus]